MLRVAATVGTQNPSIYDHFENNAALYEAMLARAVQPILRELGFFEAVTGRQLDSKRTREAQLEIVTRVSTALFAPETGGSS